MALPVNCGVGQQYSSDSTPSLGPSICCRCGPKQINKQINKTQTFRPKHCYNKLPQVWWLKKKKKKKKKKSIGRKEAEKVGEDYHFRK